jgi:hypothetical protein
MDPNYSFFDIDKHLKRFESALRHIAQCPEEEHFEECLNLIKMHKLYSQVGICTQRFKVEGKEEERCHLSQLRAVYYVYGRYIYNLFQSRGTNFRSYIYQITKKSYWVMSVLYIKEISFLQLISLY